MSEIHKALFSAYKEIKNPTKNATNPFLKNKYADLGTVIETVKETLTKHGVMVLQSSRTDGPEYIVVKTEFIHAESGTSVMTEIAVRMKEMSPQGSMGAFTYGRRYGLLGPLMLAAEDDDGNVASGKDDSKLFTEETKKEAAKGIEGILGKAKK